MIVVLKNTVNNVTAHITSIFYYLNIMLSILQWIKYKEWI